MFWGVVRVYCASLLFLCLAKEKVTKRKATFFQSFDMLRTSAEKKEALRCYVELGRTLISNMALLLFAIMIDFFIGAHEKSYSYAEPETLIWLSPNTQQWFEAHHDKKEK